MHEKKEVIKHSAAIQIQNNITLLQRRAWNVLLANAYNDLPELDEYSMSVKELMETLEFDSKNEAYLKDALKALMTCLVEWNILDKDGENEWGAVTLLSGAKIKRGHCHYRYDSELRRRLHNPSMYARISLSMQNKFVSKHAQALWELCVDYLDESRNYGETRFISLADYRKFMGIADGQYPLFKLFNTRVIKEPVAEINRVTDFHVEPEYQRQGRKVAAVKFKVRRVLELPGEHSRQASLFPEYDDGQMILELQHAGLSNEKAWQVWQQGFEGVNADKRPTGVEWDAYLREKLDLLKRRKAAGSLKSASGFLLKAIEENYSNAEFAEAEAKKATEQKRRKKATSKRQLAKAREQLEDTHAQAFHAQAVQLTQQTPSLLEDAVTHLLDNDPGFKKLYDAKKTPEENYQAAFLASYIDKQIETQHPDQFAPIQAAHAARLAELNQTAA